MVRRRQVARGHGSRCGGQPDLQFAVDDPSPAPLTQRLSLLPVWSPDGAFLLYSESVNGPGYAVRAIAADGKARAIPELWVPRGGDRYRFTADGVVLLLEEEGHQNFWWYDLSTGAKRQLTDLAQGAAIRSFDVSRDGKEIIFDRIKTTPTSC